MTKILTGLPPNDWDQRVDKLHGHLYQSHAWAQFQQAQGRTVVVASDDNWCWSAALRRGRGGVSYLYAPYGPTVAARGIGSAVASLATAARSLGADFIRFEPLGPVDPSELQHLGARQVPDMQPRYRLVLDIAPDEAELRRAISPSNRNLINTAAKRGLTFRTSQAPADLDHYLAMQRETATRGGFRPHPDTYYHQLADTLLPTGAAQLYLAEHQGHLVASAICADFGSTRYYVYAATYPELNRQHKAAVALLWWMVLDAKSHDLSAFDYGGVAPDDQSDHPWAGHTRFKRSLGGELVSSVGTWEIPLKPAKYAIYRLARKVLPS